MYDTFGKEKMHNLLTSSAKTFEEAVEKELAPWDSPCFINGLISNNLTKTGSYPLGGSLLLIIVV
jgi:hypothetical protein